MFRSLWRQLRWQIVAAQMVVVVVGVVTLIITADRIAIAQVAPAFQAAFQAAMSQALLSAALAATLVGLITSLLLIREILRPLGEIVGASQRIAAGRYDERVEVPPTTELQALAVNFNQMAEALHQVEDRRIALIGNVAHELRTPLAGLEGYLEALVDGVMPADPETFAVMQREVRRLRRLVDDLQTLSRVESGQVGLHIEPFDLRETPKRVLDQLGMQIEEGSLALTSHVPDNPVIVAADPDRVAQILINLVGNAIRYTPKGGQIRVEVVIENHCALVTVCDTGVGIPPEALPFLFERFYRVDPSRSRASGGSGIGLTIARHLAWAMGGEISAESAGLGQGSRFTLTLPLVD